MQEASIAHLKAHLADFLQRVEDGEEFTITRRGHPVALLTRPPETPRLPKLGTLRGRVRFTPGWDAPMTDAELDEFAGDRE